MTKIECKNMMEMILNEWDSSIFFYGGNISQAGFTNEQYNLMGYTGDEPKLWFVSDEFFSDFTFENSIKGQNIGHGLSEVDKSNLIEYSHLFIGLEKHMTVKYMLGLALHVNRYRYLKTRDKSLWTLSPKNRIKLKTNYSQKERATALKKKAEKMLEYIEEFKKESKEAIDLMGGINVRYRESENELINFYSNNNLTKELQNIINNPSNFIPPNKIKISISLSIISDYLKSLKLKNKSIDIKNFISQLNNTKMKK